MSDEHQETPQDQGREQEPEAPPPNEEPAIDPFAPEHLRLGDDVAESLGVQRVLTTVPIRKPKSHEFVRVRDGSDWVSDVPIFTDQIDSEVYYVHPRMRESICTETQPTRLHIAVTRQGALFVWPCRLQGADERVNTWHWSRLRAAELAKEKWTRVMANQTMGCYDTFVAGEGLPEPEWPDLAYAELLRLAFKENMIVDETHPVLKRLRGEV